MSYRPWFFFWTCLMHSLVGVRIFAFLQDGGTRKERGNRKKKGETQEGTVTRPSISISLSPSLAQWCPVRPPARPSFERRRQGARENNKVSYQQSSNQRRQGEPGPHWYCNTTRATAREITKVETIQISPTPLHWKLKNKFDLLGLLLLFFAACLFPLVFRHDCHDHHPSCPTVVISLVWFAFTLPLP